jgi:hypothetical protein
MLRAQADWTYNFTVGTLCERAASLAEKNAAARHHVLRSLISLHNEHRVYSKAKYRDCVTKLAPWAIIQLFFRHYLWYFFHLKPNFGE